MAKRVCDMDCFNCKFDDCINDNIPPRVVYTDEQLEARKMASRKMYQKNKAEHKRVNCGKKCVEGKRTCLKHLEICRKNAENATNSKGQKLWRESQKLKYFAGFPKFEKR